MQRIRRPWLSREIEELRRLWLDVRLRRRAVAARLGRSQQSVAHMIRALGIARERNLILAYEQPRLRRLHAQGLSCAEIGSRLGVHEATARNALRRLGLKSLAAPGMPGFRLRQAAAQARTARRYGVPSFARLKWLRAAQRYAAAGYPPGVTSRSLARVVDLARLLGGLTYLDLLARGVFRCRRACDRPIRRLVRAGVLVPAGRVACPVASRGQTCMVWRLTQPSREAVLANRAKLGMPLFDDSPHNPDTERGGLPMTG